MSNPSIAITSQDRITPAATSCRKRGRSLPEFNRAGLSVFLRGLHPLKTAENVASRTGIPERTLRGYLGGEGGEPSLQNFLKLFAVYGAPLLAATLDPCPPWLDDQARLAKAAELDRRIDEARDARTALLKAKHR